MGNTATSENQAPVARIFWQERPVKYTMMANEDDKFHVEEVKTPWDLFVEGVIFDSEIGDTMHQTLVQQHLERVFSIRTEAGNPICDIITIPEKAPLLDFTYGARRVFHTSQPMTIDGEKLIVLDVIGRDGKRVQEPILQLAKAFFLGNGGRLGGEHPNGLIYKEKKDIKRWRKVVESDILVDLIISSRPIRDLEDEVRRTAWYAANLEVAKMLLDQRYWRRCHINVDDYWAEKVIAYIEDDKDEGLPEGITLWGARNEKSQALFKRVEKLYEEKK